MTTSYWIVVLPGDGIGREIVDAALEVLETVQTFSGSIMSLPVKTAKGSMPKTGYR